MKKNALLIGCAGLVTAGAIFWWASSRQDTGTDPDGTGVAAQSTNTAGRTASTRPHAANSNQAERPVLEWEALGGKLSEQDKSDTVKMQDALDEGDLTGVVEAAKVLMKSESAEVRRNTVWALGWFGTQALPQLAQMLGDADEQVAKEARWQFETGLRDVSDDALKGDLLKAAFLTIQDRDDLESLSMLFNNLPDALAIRALVDIIESGKRPSADVARDQYEFTTGDPYMTREEAMKKITEPDVEAVQETDQILNTSGI